MAKKKMIGALLITVTIAILAAVIIPSLKHKNQRTQYRAITDVGLSVTGTLEKCLGLERDVSACDTLEKLISHGYSSSVVKANSLIDTIELSNTDTLYTLTLTPSASNKIYPFINETLHYTRTAEIIDRNGRPVIETWQTDPLSGCMVAGLC